jgi:acyl-CoA synthetase (AMP-forming)/AMP-acid ligase II
VAATFVEHVRAVVARWGDDRGFTFVEDGREQTSTRRTYADLDAGARARAGLVADLAGPGEPVLLLYPEGIEFLQAFLGCLYAGRVAVPAPLPHDERSLARATRIIDNAGVRCVLTTGALVHRLRDLVELGRYAGRLTLAVTDGPDLPDPAAWRMPAVGPDTPVLLQYTSGSTSDPKGVVICHEHLLSNSTAIRRAFEGGPDDHLVGWLPHYHDLGLLGTLLQPLYCAAETTFMAPTTFLKRPHRWLELVGSVKASVVVAPDFAYELCTRRITDDQLARLDLRSLRIAANGAEPIRAKTLREFTRRFAPAGFRPEAFMPCYGMAEITLFAAATPARAPFREIMVDAAALEQDRVVPLTPPAAPDGAPAPDGGTAPDGEDRGSGLVLVSSGPPAGTEIVIVDPATGEVLPADRVGEVWLRGGHVAAGYFGAPEATADAFGARTADGRGPWLRTGDLGFLIDGELVVTGRMKDVVIVNGRNIYPQDIERAAQAVHPGLASLVTAAFGVGPQDAAEPSEPAEPAGVNAAVGVRRGIGLGREHVVVIQEVVPDRLDVSLPELAASIRSRIAHSFELPAPTVALVQRGTVQRTTSGKIRRRAMREAFVGARLAPIHLEPAQPSRTTRAVGRSGGRRSHGVAVAPPSTHGA